MLSSLVRRRGAASRKAELTSTFSQTDDNSDTEESSTPQKVYTSVSAVNPGVISVAAGSTKLMPPTVLEAERPWTERSKSFRTRTIWTMVLIFSFFLIIAAGHFYCSILSVAILLAVFHEITKVKRNNEKELKLPLLFALRWYWFGLTIFYFLKKFLPTQFNHLVMKYKPVEFLIRYHSIISYGMMCCGLVLFVLSLRRATLRYQFQQLSWVLLTLLVVVVQGLGNVANIYNGLVWFLLPTLLVIVNDIFAYVFGFFFGRTPLIEVSPKKTWEGFIGGSVSTMLFAIVLCEVLERYSYFMCPQSEITLEPFRFKEVSCAEFSATPAAVASGFIGVSPLKFHALVLASFASLVAPFGGFFASGFKRAFKIKDFGDSIPGHGGLTDRFDCQIIMGMFTYIYCNTFVAAKAFTSASPTTTTPNTLSVDSVIQYAQSLNDSDKAKLIDALMGF